MEQNNLALLLKEQTKLTKQFNTCESKLNLLGDRLADIKEKISELQYGFEPTLERICAIEDYYLITRKQYKKFRNYLEMNHQYIYPHGMNGDTNQIAFSISNYTKTNNHIKEFEYLLTLIRPSKNNRKIINITDEDLSEDGAYQLLDGVKITKTAYGQTNLIRKFDSVKECLDYIYQKII